MLALTKGTRVTIKRHGAVYRAKRTEPNRNARMTMGITSKHTKALARLRTSQAGFFHIRLHRRCHSIQRLGLIERQAQHVWCRKSDFYEIRGCKSTTLIFFPVVSRRGEKKSQIEFLNVLVGRHCCPAVRTLHWVVCLQK